jgi:peptidoglycan hydrolase-like protein with peptidoglycan-binding domain
MMAVHQLILASGFINWRAHAPPKDLRRLEMKKLPLVVLSLLLALPIAVATQNKNANANANKTSTRNKSSNTNRRPVFRATVDQIKQAQALLKQRSFYAGDQTGKLDAATRAGLKKYQEAEGVKVTGTLNKLTLEKMGITLTEKQKTM